MTSKPIPQPQLPTQVDPSDPTDLRIQEAVEQGSFLRMFIAPASPTQPPYTMAYTVGLAERRLPEVLAFGVDPNSSTIVNHVGHLVLEGGITGPGFVDLGGAKPLYLGRIDDAARPRLLTYADFRLRRARFDALQLVLCDLDGHFPWQAECDKRYREIQPCAITPDGVARRWKPTWRAAVARNGPPRTTSN